jgi:cytochrome c biogenesis factor
MSEIRPYIPAQAPAPIVPPGVTVAYTAQGQPVYLPQQQAPMAPIVVQMPTQPIPAWLRNALIGAVGLLVVCTPATVLLVVAAPALAAIGQMLAFSGVGVAIAVVGVAAAIKALRETPKPKTADPVKK